MRIDLFKMLLIFLLTVPIVFSQDIPPTVSEDGVRAHQRNVEIENYIYWAFVFFFLIIVLAYSYLLSKGYIFGQTSYWLKGGLSLVILEIILLSFFYIYNFIGVNVLSLGSELRGFVLPFIIVYGSISIVPVFAIGALVGLLLARIIK